MITEPELVPIRLVLLADTGKIDVAQAIVLVEGNQKVSVSYGDIAGHRPFSCHTKGFGGLKGSAKISL